MELFPKLSMLLTACQKLLFIFANTTILDVWEFFFSSTHRHLCLLKSNVRIGFLRQHNLIYSHHSYLLKIDNEYHMHYENRRPFNRTFRTTNNLLFIRYIFCLEGRRFYRTKPHSRPFDSISNVLFVINYKNKSSTFWMNKTSYKASTAVFIKMISFKTILFFLCCQQWIWRGLLNHSLSKFAKC